MKQSLQQLFLSRNVNDSMVEKKHIFDDKTGNKDLFLILPSIHSDNCDKWKLCYFRRKTHKHLIFVVNNCPIRFGLKRLHKYSFIPLSKFSFCASHTIIVVSCNMKNDMKN
eukprot:33239_1